MSDEKASMEVYFWLKFDACGLEHCFHSIALPSRPLQTAWVFLDFILNHYQSWEVCSAVDFLFIFRFLFFFSVIVEILEFSKDF